MKSYALIELSDTRGILPLAQVLDTAGLTLLCRDQLCEFFELANIRAESLEDFFQGESPSLLHPKFIQGIERQNFDPEKSTDLSEPIGIIITDFSYLNALVPQLIPADKAANAYRSDLISLVSFAACYPKNTIVLTSPEDYLVVAQEIRKAGNLEEFASGLRLKLAGRAAEAAAEASTQFALRCRHVKSPKDTGLLPLVGTPSRVFSSHHSVPKLESTIEIENLAMALPIVQAEVHHLCCDAPCEQGINFFPINFDVKQAEAFRSLFLVKDKSALLPMPTGSIIPVFSIMSRLSQRHNLESIFCSLNPKISIFVDLHDFGMDCLEFSDCMWKSLEASGGHVIYLKLQLEDAPCYKLINRCPRQFHILSLPLLLGGSRFHISNGDDYAGENLFRKIFIDVPTPQYKFDWCWVGANNPHRANCLEKLATLRTERTIFGSSQGGHTDANGAEVPYPEYLNLASHSKINLSLNGNGLWCLKDGEMFSRHCFVLRQAHPQLNLNPLSPRDDKHWIVFDENNLEEKLNYYLTHDAEREEVRNQGHQLMHEVLFKDLWANEYLSRLEDFLHTMDKRSWGELVIG